LRHKVHESWVVGCAITLGHDLNSLDAGLLGLLADQHELDRRVSSPQIATTRPLRAQHPSQFYDVLCHKFLLVHVLKRWGIHDDATKIDVAPVPSVEFPDDRVILAIEGGEPTESMQVTCLVDQRSVEDFVRVYQRGQNSIHVPAIDRQAHELKEVD